MSKQRKLTGFFAPKRKNESGVTETSVSEGFAVDDGTKKQCFSEVISDNDVRTSASVPCIPAPAPSTSTLKCGSVSPPPELECKGHINDISNFVSKILNDDDRLTVLNKPWMPPKNYVFPLIEKYKDKKLKLKFQRQWLENFKWLLYSENVQGAYCKYCVAFAQTGGVGSQPLGHLVKNKFDNWKKAIECFKQHSVSKYHIDSVSLILKSIKITRVNQ